MPLDDSIVFLPDSGKRSRLTAAVRQRFSVFGMLLFGLMGILLGRGFYLQVVKGGDFRALAEHNRVDIISDPAPRGIIYDRRGQQLVENISSTDLIFDPTQLPSVEDEGYLLDRLREFLPDVPPEKLAQDLQRARSIQQPVVIAKALGHETVLKLGEEGSSIHGTRLVSSLVRKYPQGYYLAHILGYTGPVAGEDLAKDQSLYPTDIIGKLGIERVYDQELRGVHGASYTEVNAAGRAQTDLGKEAPVAGADLSLTVDAEFQKFIYAVFAERDQKRFEEEGKHLAAAAVALNPQNGEVVALVNYPSFDPNSFSQPSLAGSAEQFFQDERRPLFNRAVDGMYPSGSTIKPFIAAAALSEGLITPSTTVFSTGGIHVGPWSFPDWKGGGHGITDVRKAIAESVNTFFYAIVGGYESQNGLGVAKTTEYLSKFGWGRPTGIDLPSEAAGFLPSKEWKEKEKSEPWYIGDTYHLGIGQGDVLATPLQIAVATGAIAEGQYIYTPHLLGADPVRHPLDIDRQYIQVVREGMRQAITEGSGRNLADLPIALAGKTGTAQVGGTEDTHAWFTSFGPYEDPNLVITILLEGGGGGDTAAVPAAREMWSWWAEHR